MFQQGWAGATAVITGASSGIGQRIAVRIAQAGASHALIHYCGNRKGIDETAAKVAEFGAKVTILQGDFSDVDQSQSFVEAIWSNSAPVHAFVHNAGADVLTGAARDLTFEEKLERLIRVDVMGSIRLGRLVCDQMLRQPATVNPPAVAMIGWDQALEGMEGDAGQMFGPTKGAVMAFALSLAQTHAPRLRVNVVAPGWIKTSWGETTRGYWDDRAKKQSLMQRWGTPEDVADAILYACDPARTFLTGQILNVNGGWNRWPGPAPNT